MARTNVPITSFTRNSSTTAPAYTAGDQANGMYVVGGEGDKLLINVKNSNAATRDITIKAGAGGHQSQAWMGGQGDLVVTVPANTGDVWFGPFETARFEQTDGNINIDISAAAGVTIAAFRLP